MTSRLYAVSSPRVVGTGHDPNLGFCLLPQGVRGADAVIRSVASECCAGLTAGSDKGGVGDPERESEYPRDMSLKSALTPLDTVPGMSGPIRDALRGLSVTSAEEFVGLARSTPDHLQALLGLDDDELNNLVAAAESLLPRLVRDRLRVPPQRHRLGALDPRTRTR